MAKPSMFSKDYDEKMRRRKKIKGIFTVIAVLVVVIGMVLFSSNIGNSINIGIDKANNKINDKSKNAVKDEVKQQQSTKTQKKNENKNEVDTNKKTQVIKLSNGEEIKLIYSMINNQRQYIEILSKTIQYSVSPTKKRVVLLEKNTQNIIFIDEMGNVKDITKKEYVSTKGTVFNKDSILKDNPGYIWSCLPKFIDDNNVIYVSQLPWFNRGEDKFIWRYTISTNVHNQIITEGGEVSGKEISYGKLLKDGLEVIIDGNVNIIK
ncbi:hypothetical protein [Clostridium sp. ZS2-4]|uniref:hypothetical protein n=1 Tax=Clostridium sp. ZS2-4 TaxID=2987703 RepID=UPI00227A023D|nr:hypothetical protein [Clostridium sp. ZS2-4]MCY6355417.1 hypothetical protein [Clostridium sp. ZS2-4]